jgi:hypothetical protein
MPAPSSPPPGRGASSAGPRASYVNPNMRISDAERAEVADRLSVHYGDGRLDQEEFGRRLDQAMGAVTQADLEGLFADLPDPEPETGAAAAKPPRRTEAPAAEPPGELVRRPPRRLATRLIAVLVIVIAASVAGHVLAHLVPWTLIAIIAIVLLCYRPRRHH